MLTAILIVAALAAFAAGVYLIVRRGGSRGLAAAGDFTRLLQPVDLEAFQNLLDPAENEFLRRRLPAGSFRRVQRLRLRAAIGYYRRIAGNAALFLRLGETFVSSPDPAIAAAGKQLSDTAIVVRMSAVRAMMMLGVAYPWPTAGEIPSAVAGQYAQLRTLAATLGRLQHAHREVVAAS